MKQAIEKYNKGCEQLCTDICFGITNNSSYSRKFKCRLNKLVHTEVTDIRFFDRRWNGGKPRVGNAIRMNSVLAISLKQKYDDVVMRCAVQHGAPEKPDLYTFHCYVVVLFRGKGPKQLNKKNRARRNVECEMVFDYSCGKRRVWPYEFYETNLYPSTYMGRKPEIWKQDITVLRSMDFKWLMYQVIESNTYQRHYQLRIDRGIYKQPYDASRIMSCLLKKKMTIVKKNKDETYFLTEDEECDCPKCRGGRLKIVERGCSP